MKSNVSLYASLPFVGGVACTAFVLGRIVPWWVLSEISLGVWGLSLIVGMYGRKAGEGALTAMLFCCGVFCYSSRVLTGDIDFTALDWAAVRLRHMISSVGFRGEQTGALLDALLTGNRSSLPKETLTVFRHSGASHLLALSGLHLGILAGVVNKALKLLGNSRRAELFRTVAVIAISGFYTLMCGASPSLVRAFLFISLSSAAYFFPGRRPRRGAVLCGAATVQLAFDPLAINSLAFQMSYLAVMGIVFIQPVLEGWYPSDGSRFDPMRRIWSAAALGLSCQITTAPLVWVKFRTFPGFFLLTNLLAMPLCEATIVAAAVLLLVCGVNGKASGIIPEALIWIVDSLSGLLLKVLEIISSLT